MKKKALRLKDLAQLLGVSHTTVSRALNNHPDISEATRERVKQAAAALHYTPNAMAAHFREQRSKTLGVIMPFISFYFFPSVLRSIEAVAHANGYNVMITQSGESTEREAANARLLLNNRVDGVLASIAENTLEIHHFAELEEAGVPVVYFDRVPSQPGLNRVVIDGEKAAYQGTLHLISKGFRRLVMVAGHPSLSISRSRVEGFRAALHESGLGLGPSQVLHASSRSEAALLCGRAMLGQDKPDAFFAISDEAMSGVVLALAQLPPEQSQSIGLLCFSDGELPALFGRPVSYIHHSGQLVGQEAALLLLRRLHHPSELTPRTLVLETVLREPPFDGL